MTSVQSTFNIAAGATAAIVGALAYKYPNRVVFTDARADIASIGGYPLIGVTPDIVRNRERIQELFMENFDKVDEMTL